MRRHAAHVLVALAMLAAACRGRPLERPAPDPASRRTTPSGAVVGLRADYGSHAWLGIPYARPPVGALRWRAPQPPEPWTGTREALADGAACTQYPSLAGGVSGPADEPGGSEDCLVLNVWAPPFAPDAVPAGAARLPVMVWIHGGGHTIGEGGFYNGGNLAVTHRLIVVTINYRLGPFGWFRHAALRDGDASPAERSGNFGTLDLVRALAWVRDHAGAFGGDPGNVTVFGESAGGVNVFSLLLAPQARGLLWIFPRLRDERRYNLTAEYLAKLWKAEGVDEPAAVLRAAQGPSVFAYRFDWDEEPRVMGADLGVMLGAAHVFEVPFVFGHFDLGREGNVIFSKANEPGRLALAAQMMSYWAEFAYAGAPGRGRDGRLPEWAPWDGAAAATPKYLVLDTPAGGRLRMSAETVSRTGVVAAVEADPRLATPAEKCEMLGVLARWGRGYTPAEYARRAECAAYPLPG
jgi:carboxylesterase type B